MFFVKPLFTFTVIAKITFRLIAKVTQDFTGGHHEVTNGSYMMFWRLS